MVRFSLAWAFNVALYILACLVALTYGVMFGAPEFSELLIAWLAGLSFTWLVVEPAEVCGLVLCPKLLNNDYVERCRTKAKDLPNARDKGSKKAEAELQQRQLEALGYIE